MLKHNRVKALLCSMAVICSNRKLGIIRGKNKLQKVWNGMLENHPLVLKSSRLRNAFKSVPHP